jgi:integrase
MSVWKHRNSYRFRVMRQGRVIAGVARTFAQAKELEAKAITDLHCERVGRPPKHTLEEAILKYVQSPEFTDLRSRRSLESHLRACVPFVERRLLTQAVEVAEEMKRAMRAQGLKPATINRRLQILRRVCNLAYKRWGWLDRPVGDRIALLPENNQRQIYLTEAEAASLIAAVSDPRARAAVTIAVYTGLRAGEIFGLTRDDIKADVIVLAPSDIKFIKGNRPKVIPILPQARWALDLVPLPITYRVTMEYFWEARRAIGRPELHFHDLRHTLASWLINSGATLKDVQAWLGHESLVSTDRYAHISVERLKEVAKKLWR